MPKLIFFAGSARKESFNKKLAKAASEKAKELGADVTFIDLADYEMPLFCEDYEAENGMPETAKALAKIFHEHDGFLIASPEYNASFSPLLKNTLDWLSRPNNESLAPYAGKVTALMAASPGALGGIRGLPQLRHVLSNIAMNGTHVIPKQFCLGAAHKAFDNEGNYTGDNPMFEATIKEFVDTAGALS